MTTITTPQSPRALVFSVLLHVAIVGAILLFAWISQRTKPEPPAIFELVAGEGMDYQALEAPTTAAPAVKAPEMPAPVVPPAPKIERVPEPPKVEPPPPKTPPKQEPPPPKKEPPPPKVEKKDPPAPKIEKAPERLKYDQFTKQNPVKTTPPKAAPPITPKTIDAEKIAGRVATGSTNTVKEGASGTALSRVEADLWTAYQSLLVERIRRSMQQAGILDLRAAGVEFSISVEGVISGARITSGSGSREFDDGVLNALRGLGRVPPPPSGKAERLQVTINMRERT